jgi:hypothetical protein
VIDNTCVHEDKVEALSTSCPHSRAKRKVSLVGRFFHSVKPDGETINWQGLVEGHVGGPKDLYLVQLYEWVMGGESDQVLVSSEQMIGWRFYDSAEDMAAYYQQYAATKGEI